MNRIIKTSAVLLGLAVVVSLGACAPDPYSYQGGVSTNTQPVYYAPNPPPPPMAESIPPAPGPTVYWQAGHWGWTGAKWIWLGGHYENRPTRTAVWTPGQW